MLTYLEFEKPISALDQRINELRETATAGDIDIDSLEVVLARAADAYVSQHTAGLCFGM